MHDPFFFSTENISSFLCGTLESKENTQVDRSWLTMMADVYSEEIMTWCCNVFQSQGKKNLSWVPNNFICLLWIDLYLIIIIIGMHRIVTMSNCHSLSVEYCVFWLSGDLCGTVTWCWMLLHHCYLILHHLYLPFFSFTISKHQTPNQFIHINAGITCAAAVCKRHVEF